MELKGFCAIINERENYKPWHTVTWLHTCR